MSSYYSSTKCHTEFGAPVFEFKIGNRKVRVTAGGSSRNGSWDDLWECPDLVIGPESTIGSKFGLFTGPFAELANLVPLFAAPSWPDMGVPMVNAKAFWPALFEIIKKQDSITHIHAQCQGGHGRTGLTLVLLYNHFVKHNMKTLDSVVKKLRELYCDHIVESRSQFLYLEEMTGLEWKEEETPYKSSSYTPSKSVTATNKSTSTGNNKTIGSSSYGGQKQYKLGLADILSVDDVEIIMTWAANGDVRLTDILDAIDIMAAYHGYDVDRIADPVTKVNKFILRESEHDQGKTFENAKTVIEFLFDLYDKQASDIFDPDDLYDSYMDQTGYF